VPRTEAGDVRRGTRACCVAATAAVLLAQPAEAQAANLDSFALANDAAITAETVVATTSNGGAAWYNPAGLALIPHGSVDLTATSLVLRVREFSEPLSVRLPTHTRSKDVSATDFFSVPTSLVLARRLGERVVGAFGVFVTRQEFVSASALMQEQSTLPNGTPYSYDLYLDITQQSSSYHLGPSVGWQLTPSLRLGAALFGVYEKLLAFDQFAARLDVGAGSDLERRSAANQVKQTATLFGLRPAAAVQWDVTPDWHVGAVLRGPTTVLSEVRQTTLVRTEASSSTGPTPGITARVDSGRPALQRSGPARVHVALARDVGKGFVAVGADYQGGFLDERGDPSSEPVWNVRAGARLWPGDDLALGAGFFTDRSPTPSTEQSSRAQVDYYGVTLGGEVLRRYPLRDREASSIVLSTTVALRYALGFGTLNGILVEPFSTEFATYRPNRVDVVLHEVLLHVGSSLEL
jgi:hypothetical protein